MLSGTVRPGAINLFLSISFPVHVLVGRLEKDSACLRYRLFASARHIGLMFCNSLREMYSVDLNGKVVLSGVCKNADRCCKGVCVWGGWTDDLRRVLNR